MGPESTGTRVLTQVLISAGCMGDGGHEQRFDEEIPPPEGIESDIVWRRSVPHFEEELMPNLDRMSERLTGYEIQVLLTTRSLYPTAKSQMRHRQKLTTLEQAYSRIQNGYAHAFREVQDYDFIVVPYESLKQTHKKICNMLGLGEPDIEIYDANSKYFT
jgi:hypothetical protein